MMEPLQTERAFSATGEESTSSNRLLEALVSLNKISAKINRLGADASASVEDTLRLIVESAIKVAPGTSAVIYTYDHERDIFDFSSRVSAGERDLIDWDRPRPDGMGRRAITERRRVLSDEEDGVDIHPGKIEAGARMVVCFPLIVADQSVGVLYVYLHEARQFDPLELQMLDNFVNQAAMAIYHERRVSSVERHLLRREEELARLHRAGLLISSRPRLEDTLEAILQMALEVIKAQYGIFRLIDKTGTRLYTAAITGDDLSRPLMEDLEINSVSVSSWVARNRQPVLIPDLSLEPWSNIYYPLDNDLNMRSELAVPLIGSSGRLEGVLNLESPEVGAFSQADNHLLQALATQAVVAIQEVRLLDALQDVAERLLTQPCQQVLKHLAVIACDLLNTADSAIWVLDDDTLVLQAASADHAHDDRIPLAGSLTGRAILEHGLVISDSVRADPAFYRPDLATAQDWARALIVPLLAGDDQEPVGALSVYSVESNPGHFVESAWDKKVLTILAHYVALAVQNEARQQALRAAQSQHTLAETFAALGDIAANVLHQLNNKVGSIPVRVQGIQDKCQPALDAEPYLATNLTEIEKSASGAMAAVRESLSLLQPIHLAPVSIAKCLEDALVGTALPADVHVQVDGLADLPPVVLSRQGLTMVFANLLENAAHAIDGAGTITVGGALRDGRVEVSVHDTGSGIPAELQGHIFEFNFSRQATGSRGKLGFGLWWVKTLMVRLGGLVTVESDGQQGTTFWLKIPLAEKPPSGEPNG